MVVQGVTLVFALGVILTNFLVDVVSVALDPRIKPVSARRTFARRP